MVYYPGTLGTPVPAFDCCHRGPGVAGTYGGLRRLPLVASLSAPQQVAAPLQKLAGPCRADQQRRPLIMPDYRTGTRGPGPSARHDLASDVGR